jgi:capsular polysaccharide transport system ATP-binding protein
MIELHQTSKTFVMEGVRKTVLQPTNLVLPAGKSVGLIGRNGAGKTTLLRMISGTIPPTSGQIVVKGSISWPVGFAGSFHADLSGAQNARYVARLYGVDSEELVAFTADFAELGEHFNLPCRTYSSGMLSRLAFGVSMGIAFDTYLVDEITAVGDAAFRTKSNKMFLDRMQSSGAIVVAHSMGLIRELCDSVIVLDQGKLSYFDKVAEGIAFHERIMAGG